MSEQLVNAMGRRPFALHIVAALLLSLAEGLAPPVIVVGKVIIDEYGDPAKLSLIHI